MHTARVPGPSTYSRGVCGKHAQHGCGPRACTAGVCVRIHSLQAAHGSCGGSMQGTTMQHEHPRDKGDRQDPNAEGEQ